MKKKKKPKKKKAKTEKQNEETAQDSYFKDPYNYEFLLERITTIL